MSRLSAFHGPIGFVTLHPLFTLGGGLVVLLSVAAAARRKARVRKPRPPR
ncbi:MAG: hypothetical protein KGO51_02450 [Alphaproteobacteria bacterium]|nr:hypothetical protein [Alphaproteobacteria bacterium]